MSQTKAFSAASSFNGGAVHTVPTPVSVPLGFSRRAIIPIAQEERGICMEISGTILAERRIAGFRVVETRYERGAERPRHYHTNACFIYVLEGSFTETYAPGSSVTCAAETLRFIPAGCKHSTRFDATTRCLVVEVEREALARVDKHTKALERPGEIQGLSSAWLAQRLYHELQQPDALALMSLEGILLEMLADGARHAGVAGPAKAVPQWLRSAREYLEANFLRPLSLTEVAGMAGVHRVHLSREFRRHFQSTVGEFLRRKRVEHACHLVSKTNNPLADVAMTCGFSDQSHFSATFRRQVGFTPGRFRQMAQPR